MKEFEKILHSRENLSTDIPLKTPTAEGEGGCGVIGLASSSLIKGKHLKKAIQRMLNRGNGKGGGIAAVGLSHEDWGVDKETLEQNYLITVAFLDKSIIEEAESNFIRKTLDVKHEGTLKLKISEELQVDPPLVKFYFARVNEQSLSNFMTQYELEDKQKAEDEFIYQNSFTLNKNYYEALGEKRAFVLSHGKNMTVLKIVGHPHQVYEVYDIDEFKAHVWIAHTRYPTKGIVWHPGGAHPFIGLNEALVHNGDFANYQGVREYLAQRNIFPLFLTDTEVAALQFDLYSRVYQYTNEEIIEAMAPTTERDFLMLEHDKQQLYKNIQNKHLHGSPDGPWFFIVAQSKPTEYAYNLIGITDTSMLRPQVFALYNGEESIGVIASERQAIDAVLASIASEDNRFSAKADRYWNARGGSYVDGGAFIFSVINRNDKKKLICTNKFGEEITPIAKSDNKELDPFIKSIILSSNILGDVEATELINNNTSIFQLIESIRNLNENSLDDKFNKFRLLSHILDRKHLIPNSFDGRITEILETTINGILDEFPIIGEKQKIVKIDYDSRDNLIEPTDNDQMLVYNVAKFQSEGVESASRQLVEIYKMGWKKVISYNWEGQRFCGAGLGPNSHGFELHVFGNPGDYLASGLDGAEIYVHTSAQDQVAQIMRSGKLVIYGDVGQTFMYGAKGGEVYVLGNAAGRPLINAGGKPHVIINGTCLDYLAESFMAADPLRGGGFVLLNGLTFDNEGDPVNLPTSYSGGNLFSLAAGGAIYLRDPYDTVHEDQLHGGEFIELSINDFDLIHQYLMNNLDLFGFSVSTEKDETNHDVYLKAYKKIIPLKNTELTKH